MNLDRLRWGEWIAAIAGVNLLLVTFRAWYKLSGGGGHITAWNALHTGRWLLLATAVVGILQLLIRGSEDAGQLGDLPVGWITALFGLASTVYIAYRLATPPVDQLDPDIGLYLGLLSAIGVMVGGLLSAREAEAADATAEPEFASGGATGPGTGDALVPDSGGTWSPAAPAAASTGWSPAAPVPPATAAGAGVAGADRPLRNGDHVALTTGGARFPAGTIAEVVEVFGGGALVEVKAPDGMAERFEVPDSAFERVPAGGGAGAAVPSSAPSPSTAGESWSPAMPAPAGDDWGFDDPSAGGAAAPGAGEAAEEAPAEKVPWWKRDIGGGKKKRDAELVAAAGAGAAAGALVEHEHNSNGDATPDEKPGFFKRIFGGGGHKDDAAAESTTETESAGSAVDETSELHDPEPEPTPAADVAGLGAAAESDTSVAEPPGDAVATTEPDIAPPSSEGGEAVATGAPDPAPPAADAGAVDAAAPVAGAAAEAAPEPEAAPPASDPIVAHDPEPAAADPDLSAADPDTPAGSAAPEPAAEAPAVAEPAAAAKQETPAEPIVEPDPVAARDAPTEPVVEPEPVAEPEAVAAPDAGSLAADDEPPAAPVDAPPEPAAAAEVAPAADDEPPKPKRKRSSGSRKVPKEVTDAAGDAQPKVGDQVQLKVGGGKYEAGTKARVVDVFSAGVIVEIDDDAGRSERLDLPFEAIAPADA